MLGGKRFLVGATFFLEAFILINHYLQTELDIWCKSGEPVRDPRSAVANDSTEIVNSIPTTLKSQAK
jgi:hypothetical protein